MRCRPIESLVPWWLEHADVNAADEGQLALSSDVMKDGQPQRLLAMHVVGQIRRDVSLGLVAIRCERHRGELIPLTLCIPDTPPVQPEKRGLDITLLSGRTRHVVGDDGILR
jgi:hypothetical protein